MVYCAAALKTHSDTSRGLGSYHADPPEGVQRGSVVGSFSTMLRSHKTYM